jgi:alpha-L-rhamnosidase
VLQQWHRGEKWLGVIDASGGVKRNPVKHSLRKHKVYKNMRHSFSSVVQLLLRQLCLVILVVSVQACLLADQSAPKAQSCGFQTVDLEVEYLQTPQGIDDAEPRFSWKMRASGGQRGLAQTAYQVQVRGPGDDVVWDTGKVARDESLGIVYAGKPLQAETRYTWAVQVWANNGATASADSWFETGLMSTDPAAAAWQGARWIGTAAADTVLYSHYLSVYKLGFRVQLDAASASTRAAFVLAANDSRLQDPNKNLYGLASEHNGSYLALELDVTALDGTAEGLAKLNIYRVGYHPEDDRNTPLASIDVPQKLLNVANRYAPQQIYIHCNTSRLSIFLGGEGEEHRLVKELVVNPLGGNHDYISFPMLADIGFELAAGQQAAFDRIEIKHYRAPSASLFQEQLDTAHYDGIFADVASEPNSGLRVAGGRYRLDGGRSGTLVVADPSRNAMPMLRREFAAADKAITAARLSVTARGIYEVYLNGQRVGEDYLNPGLTQYNRTHMYQSYDVTTLLRAGDTNAIGAMLGEGWWSGHITFHSDMWNFFGDRQSLLAKLVIDYADGTSDVITTQPDSWKYYSDGPLRYTSLFQGEVYDATRDPLIDGWSTADYDDSHWQSAAVVPLSRMADFNIAWPWGAQQSSFTFAEQQLRGQIGNNARVVKTLAAQSVEAVRPGVFVYDMGQNMVGAPSIQMREGTAGDRITLRYAEVRYPDLPESGANVGMLMLENIRAALAQDIHILRGADDLIAPRFTFHGYRFIEISGIDKPLPLAAVQGRVISSVEQLSSYFESSNPLVNKLWENISWSLRGNFLSIPTDTPARNERMGWSGDINVFARTATYLADVGPFLRRHMLAMRDLQREDGRFSDVAPIGGGFGGTLWGSAGIVVPWEVYRQYGDVKILREHYPAMQKYLAYLDTRIDAGNGVLDDGPLGDWLSPEGSRNDNTLLWSAYHVYDLNILAQTAAILGKSQQADVYRQRYAQRRAHFNTMYVDPSTGKTIKSGQRTFSFGPPDDDNGESATSHVAGTVIDTQASYAVPLALGVFTDEHAKLAARHLVNAVQRENVDDNGVERPAYSLMTGFIGTAAINRALSQSGYHAIAYRLLQQTSYPSWLYPVLNGATTIWERLNSYTREAGFGGNNSMNSFNHYSFGAVGDWLYNFSLGIQRDPEVAGFKQFILQPTPDPDATMTWASGYYDSVYGRIESGWEIDGDRAHYALTVPANTSARLHLVATAPTAITESGGPANAAAGVEYVGYEDGRAVYRLAAGSYRFTTPWAVPAHSDVEL